MVTILCVTGLSTLSYGQEKTEEVVMKCNVTCGGCKANIENKLSDVEGISSVDASIDAKTVTVSYDPTETTAEKVSHALKDAGYANKILKGKGKTQKSCSDNCKKKRNSDCSKDCSPETHNNCSAKG